MHKGRERRLQIRYDAGGLSIRIRGLASDNVTKTLDAVTALDFSPYNGVAFSSHMEFSVGDRLELDLSLQREHISGIIGEVANKTEIGHNQFRYGVQFDFTANEHMQSFDVHDTLENIDHLMKKVSHSPKKVKRARLRKTIRRSKGQAY